MKWKISKIKIQSFKAFEEISFDFERSTLLTLDGPNGYGKTSIFDAIELLLTRKIGRIDRLFTSIMPAAKKIYEDNLYWNKKQRETDLYIKAEFINTESNERLFLARMAKASDLRKTKTNRADNFEAFNLYKLDSYDSEKFTDKIDDITINSYFGENFVENYSLLNYLEQGQNSFLFSKKIDKRKEALEQLINTAEINAHIEKYVKIEQRINKNHLSKEKEADIESLNQKISLMHQQIGGDLTETPYVKLSTAVPQISWDKESPFTVYDQETYQSHTNEILRIKELILKKNQIGIRLKNQEIDRFLTEKNELLEKTIKIGKHLQKFEDSKRTKLAIDKLTKDNQALTKDTKLVALTDLGDLIEAQAYGLTSNIVQLLEVRDLLLSQSSDTTVAITELGTLKESILETFKKIHELEGTCPLCGYDWPSQRILLGKIEARQSIEVNNLGAIGLQLESILKNLSGILTSASTAAKFELDEKIKTLDNTLYLELLANQEHFLAITGINERLASFGIDYSATFTTDQLECERRTEDLKTLIKQKKDPESGDLPENWQLLLTQVFENISDLYALEVKTADTKLRYITFKFNEIQNTTITDLQKNLTNLQSEKKAAAQIKTRINTLKTKLTQLEKKYAGQTISDIELTFHIYSGRLIQNYQRGLGLFIERGDGSHLRFATAERSEHDALLSMSSGQISALSLAFFFSLNRVYSQNTLILIDDPAQSLDEINIASLSDLLRCELKDRQILISSHEDDISSYMRYRFARAGLPQKGIHMQQYTTQKQEVDPPI